MLAGAVPPYLYKSDDNPDGGLDDATIAQFEGGVTSDRLAFLDEFTKNFFTAGERARLISEPQRLYAPRHRRVRLAEGHARLHRRVRSHRLPRRPRRRSTVPTLVIHGDADAIVPFEVSGKRSHEAIAGSELVLIEGGPHGLNATHAEEFNRALLDFLAR